jgi:release factor glutamine methyltransferase
MSVSTANSVLIANTLRAAGCVFAEDEARLLIDSAGSTAELDSMVARRVSGLPLEHIIGWAEFSAADPVRSVRRCARTRS